MINVLIVITGFMVYGVVHSLLAGQGMKDWVHQHLSDRAFYGFYRAGYNIFAIVTILPILWWVGQNPGNMVYRLDESWRLPMNILRWVGMIGLVVSLIQIDLLRFAGLKQMFNYFTGGLLPLPDEPLQTKGLYRLVRHPLYLFSLMTIWSSLGMNESTFGLNAAFTLYFLIGSYFEERRMVHYFGKNYTDYQRQVPWLFPRLPSRNKS